MTAFYSEPFSLSYTILEGSGIYILALGGGKFLSKSKNRKNWKEDFMIKGREKGEKKKEE